MSGEDLVYSSAITFALMTILVLALLAAYFVLGIIVAEYIGTVIVMVWFLSFCAMLMAIALTYP